MAAGQTADLVLLGTTRRRTISYSRPCSTRTELSEALGEVAPVFTSVIRHSARSAFDTRRAGELAHEYETVASSSKGQRLKALREGGGAALTRLRRFSWSADGLAEDYAALVEEIVTRLGELEPVKAST